MVICSVVGGVWRVGAHGRRGLRCGARRVVGGVGLGFGGWVRDKHRDRVRGKVEAKHRGRVRGAAPPHSHPLIP